MNAFEKTEKVLRNYKNYKLAAQINDYTEMTKKFLCVIDTALKTIEHDPYYKMIDLIYFKDLTREHVAEIMNCDIKTVTRNKNKLVNELKVIIFSDDTIKELFH